MFHFHSFYSSISSLEEKKQEPSDVPEEFINEIDNIVEIVQQEDWYKNPLVVLVVGASGDLAKKKTYPALFDLWKHKLLPPQTVIWGFARTAHSHAQLRSHLRPYLVTKRESAGIVDEFLESCFYQNGKSYGDGPVITEILQQADVHNLLVYLAIPPHVFGESTMAVKTALGTVNAAGFTRVVIEKPFGHDTASCYELLQVLRDQKWPESDMYRVDHYLGKAVVRAILELRRSNPWLKPLWNRNMVQAVHIIFKEPFGTEGRGGYFDPYGIIRDILQNHLMQVLTLVAMELPEIWTAENVRSAKVDVLKNMPNLGADDCLLGQYIGYKDDPTIENLETTTPTYACVRCFVPSETWQDVPFVLEAGKALDERLCEVRLLFKGEAANALVLRLQPSPAIFLTTNLVTPGFSQKPISTHLGVSYEKCADIPDAYTRLLLDVLRGDQASFVRDDELIEAWKRFTPLLNQTEGIVTPYPYEQGSTGPNERTKFLRDVGVTQTWLPPPSAL